MERCGKIDKDICKMIKVMQIAFIVFVILQSNGYSSGSNLYGATIDKGKNRACAEIPMHSITPFYIYDWNKNHNSAFGLELNKWKGHHPSNNECNPIFGYGIKASVGGNGLYISPCGLFSITDIIEIVGLSLGPELGGSASEFNYGVSIRAWITFVGMQFSIMRKDGAKYGIYLYLPIHQVMLQ